MKGSRYVRAQKGRAREQTRVVEIDKVIKERIEETFAGLEQNVGSRKYFSSNNITREW